MALGRRCLGLHVQKVKALLQKVKRAKGAGFEFDFSEEVAKVAEDVKKVAPVLDQDKIALEILNRALGLDRPQRDERTAAIVLDSWRRWNRRSFD